MVEYYVNRCYAFLQSIITIILFYSTLSNWKCNYTDLILVTINVILLLDVGHNSKPFDKSKENGEREISSVL